MNREYRLLAVLFLGLLVGAFALNRWAFRKEPPLDQEIYFALINTKPEIADNAKKLFEVAWDDSYAAPLLDLASVTSDKQAYQRIMDILSDKTGQNFSNDVNAAYVWLWNRPANTPTNYMEFKSKLYGMLSVNFGKYFNASFATNVRLDEVRWTGSSLQSIPPLISPKLLTAGEATYLQPDNIVYGVVINGEARAYPKRIVAWHELVHDRIGNMPVVAIHCTLNNAMMLYRSSVEPGFPQLVPSAFIYRSNNLLTDSITHSLWSSLLGMPVVGPLANKGILLEPLPVVTTTWAEWVRRHPDTKTLSLDTGFKRDYNEGSAYRDYESHDDLMFPVPSLDKRLKNKEAVLAIRQKDNPTNNLVIAKTFLDKHSVYNDSLAKIPVVVLTDKSGANRVYERNDLEFIASTEDTATDKNQKVWKITEEALVGPNDQKLKRMPAHRIDWYAWHALHSKTRLVQ